MTAQTGIGKSYSTGHFIADTLNADPKILDENGYTTSVPCRPSVKSDAKLRELESVKKPRMIIFVTRDKKNIDEVYNDVQARCPHARLLRLYSKDDQVSKAMGKVLDGNLDFPASLKRSDAFGKLEEQFSKIRDLENNLAPGSQNNQSVQKMLQEQHISFNSFANEFHRVVQRKFAKDLTSQDMLEDAVDLLQADQRLIDNRPSGCSDLSDLLLDAASTQYLASRLLWERGLYRWVAEFWPENLVPAADAVFCTIAKLFTPIRTLFGSIDMFRSPEVASSIIFIDEIDQAKKAVDSLIVKQGVNSGIHNIMEELRRLAPSFTVLDGSKDERGIINVVRPVPDRFKRDILRSDLDIETYNRICESATAVVKDVRVDRDFVTKGEGLADQTRIPFLWRDGINCNVYIPRHAESYLVVDQESSKYENIISEKSGAEKKDSLDIQSRRVIGLLNRICAWIYRQTLRSVSMTYDNEEFPVALYSILHELSFSRLAITDRGEKNVEAEGFFNQIAHMGWNYIAMSRALDKEDWLLYDDSYYFNGVEYVFLENGASHKYSTVIYRDAATRTSELWLACLSSNNYVIGLSATAQIPSILKNFSLDFLQDCLPGLFDEQTQKDADDIAYDAEMHFAGIEDVSYDVETVPISNDNASLFDSPAWRGMFSSEAERTKAENILAQMTDEEFVFRRYARVMWVFQQFCAHEEMQSFLAFTNASPNTRKSGFSEAALRCLLSVVAKDPVFPQGERAEDMFVVLRTASMAAQMKELRADLKAGKRRFVLSAYGTTGTGVNIKYDIDKCRFESQFGPLIKVGHLELCNGPMVTKDFDGVYCERPTHVQPTFQYDPELKAAENEVHRMDTLRSLSELAENGEISVNSKNDMAKRVIQVIRLNDAEPDDATPSPFRDSFKGCPSVSYGNLTVVAQALGRIDRAPWKSAKNHLFVEENLLGELTEEQWAALPWPMSKAVTATVEHVLKSKTAATGEFDDIDIENARTLQRASSLHDRIVGNWSPKRISRYEKLGDILLRHPVVTSEEVANRIVKHHTVKQCYIQLREPSSKLLYKSDSGEIKWNKTYLQLASGKFRKQNQSATGFQEVADGSSHEVSASSTRLDRMMQIDCVKRWFIAHGFATEFVQGTYHMAPEIAKYFYQGRIGEQAALAIFQEWGLELLPIYNPDEYELFDFKLKTGGADTEDDCKIYVDAKNWGKFDLDDKYSDLIEHKLDEIGGTGAIIVNILPRDDDPTLRRFRMGPVPGHSRIMTVPFVVDHNGNLLREVEYRVKERILAWVNAK